MKIGIRIIDSKTKKPVTGVLSFEYLSIIGAIASAGIIKLILSLSAISMTLTHAIP